MPTLTSSRSTRLTLEVLALLAVLMIGTLLRWAPVARSGGADFAGDRAFHLRMVAEVVHTGAVPERDALALAPHGKPIPVLLPTLLYHVFAGYHALRTADPGLAAIERSCLELTALLGAAIALPVFALLRGLGLGALPALVAALAATAVPAHVHRTIAPWLRYDALGTLLLTAHLSCLVLAVSQGRGRAFTALASASTLFLCAAVAAWRLSLAWVLIESLIALAAFLFGSLRRPLLITLAANLGGVLLLSMLVPYLARGPEGPFIIGQIGALVFITLVILLLDAPTGFHLERRWPARAARAALVAGAVAVALGFGVRHESGLALGAVVRQRLGVDPAHVEVPSPPAVTGSDDEGIEARSHRHEPAMRRLLALTTSELAAGRARHWLDADFFALLPLAVLVYWLGRWRRVGRLPAPGAWRQQARGHWRDGLWLWHLAALIACAGTLAFARTKVLAGPLIAVETGLLLGAGRAAPAAAGGAAGWKTRAAVVLPPALLFLVGYLALRGPLRSAASPAVTILCVALAVLWTAVPILQVPAGRRQRWPGTAALATGTLVTATLLWTCFEAINLGRVLPTRLPPETRAMLDVLATRARPGDVVLCDWGRGYAVQTHAGLPTSTDGFLESPENRRRIGAYALALYDSDPATLRQLCASLGVRYLWIPGRRRTMLARYAGVEVEQYFRGSEPTARGWNSNFARALWAPQELECLRPVLRIGADRLLEFDAECARAMERAHPPQTGAR